MKCIDSTQSNDIINIMLNIDVDILNALFVYVFNVYMTAMIKAILVASLTFSDQDMIV